MEEPIDYRPADAIAPQMDSLRAELAGKPYKNITDEDVLSYALFPDVAEAYFAKHRV